MAKKKKEQLQYGQLPIPQGQKEYSRLKLDWSGLNRRQVIDTGVLSMESNISTAESPYLVPSQKRNILRDTDNSEDVTPYENPISMFGFDNLLIVVYWDNKKVKVDYIEISENGEQIKQVHTGIVSSGVDKSTVNIPRSMVQFNVYESSTDVLDGTYVKKLLLFPDKVSMYMKIVTVDSIEEMTNPSVMYYQKGDNQYYTYSNENECFVYQSEGEFKLDSLDVVVKSYYCDGYRKSKSGSYYNDGYKLTDNKRYSDGFRETSYTQFYDGYSKVHSGTYDSESGAIYYHRSGEYSPYTYTVAILNDGDNVAGLFQRAISPLDEFTDTTFYERSGDSYPFEYTKVADLDYGNSVEGYYERVYDSQYPLTQVPLYERIWNEDTYEYKEVTDLSYGTNISKLYEKTSDKDVGHIVYYKRLNTGPPYKYEAVTNLDYGDSVSKYYMKTEDYSPPEGSNKHYYWMNTYISENLPDEMNTYAYSADANEGAGGFVISIPPAFPNLKYAAVHLSRLFGVDDDRVHVSGFNDYSNWNLDTVTESNESNAWSSAAQSNTKANGEFTGIAVYDNHVVCFKHDFMHEIYNNKNPFRLVDIYAEGCIDNRSIQEVDGRLIFVSADEVKIYTGSNPRTIGYNLGIDCFTAAVSGSDSRNYYLYCEDKDKKGYLFVYDTFVGQWSQQAIDGDVQVLNFARNKNGMYAFFSDGLIYKMDTGKYNHDWSFETDMSTALTASSSTSYPTVSIKHLTKVQMLAYVAEKSSFKVYALYDNEEFNADTSHLLYDSAGKTGLLPIRLKPRMTANYGFKLHFEGAGYVRLYGMELRVSAGGELFV